MSKKHKKRSIDKRDIVEDDELPVIALDHKRRISDGVNCNNTGWKFYISIKDELPGWWYQFNGDLGEIHESKHSKYSYKAVKSKYRNVKEFARHKIKNNDQHRSWLELMISPKKIWERKALSSHGKRYEVPWLGDWDARRRNGYWQTDNKDQIKFLSKAIKDNLSSNEAIRATAPFVVQTLMRWVRLQEKIDSLFNGEPFNDDYPSKNALMRFKLYTSMHEEVERLKRRTYRMWMTIQGIDPKKPHEMWDMATMVQAIGQSTAASALTGYSAGQLQSMHGQDGRPNGDHQLSLNGKGIIITPDALLLAQHLVKSSQTFKKPLPPMVEGELVERAEKDKKDKANGHTKAN